MVLRLLPCVAVYSRHGAGFDVARFDVLKSLQADVVEKEEGLLTNSLALMKKLTIRFLPLCRSAHVVTLEHRRLESVSHDLTHDEKIKLIVTQFSKRGSEGAIVLNREQHGTRSLGWSVVTFTAPVNKRSDTGLLLVVQTPVSYSYLTHLR